MDEMRGVIRNEEYAKQLRDFKGLKFGNITPSDVDGLIEYKDSCYVQMEFKYGNAEMPRGQELCFKRLVRDLGKVKPTLGILAQHWTPPDKAIDCAETLVIKAWYGEREIELPKQFTTRELIDQFFHSPKQFEKWDYKPPESQLERLQELAKHIDWRHGVRCGITEEQCKFCKGVPCNDSMPWAA